MVLQDFQVSNFCICLGAATYVFFSQNGSFARIHDWLSSCRFFFGVSHNSEPPNHLFCFYWNPRFGYPVSSVILDKLPCSWWFELYSWCSTLLNTRWSSRTHHIYIYIWVFFDFQPKEWDDDPKLTIHCHTFQRFQPFKNGTQTPDFAEDASFSTPTG